MDFNTDFQLLSPRLSWVDFYDFHHGFFIEFTPLDTRWIFMAFFMAFTIDFQLLSFLYIMITRGPHANYDGTK